MSMAAAARRNRVILTQRRRCREYDRFGICKENVEGKGRLRWCLWKGGKQSWLGIAAGMAGSGCAAILCFLDASVKAMEHPISLPRYPWRFNGLFNSFDHAALRRGWQIYRTVCRTCHSLRYVRFLDLAEASHTREEAKAIASEFEVEDGPDQEGNYYKRACKVSDTIPSPYPNEQAARANNFGAYPPDLTHIVLARKRGTDYLFSLLTGWMEPPAGVRLSDQRSFNVYFPGGTTTMAQMFYEGMVEFDDGTPATESQMAKDVVEFLSWTAAPEHDTRKIMTLKCMGIMILLVFAAAHINRRIWSHLRSRRIAYVPKRSG